VASDRITGVQIGNELVDARLTASRARRRSGAAAP
jgi:hypothetical protein